MVFKFGLSIVHFLTSLGKSIIDRVALLFIDSETFSVCQCCADLLIDCLALWLISGGTLLLMVSSALFLLHCVALLFVLYRTLLRIQSVVHLFQLGLVDFHLDSRRFPRRNNWKACRKDCTAGF